MLTSVCFFPVLAPSPVSSPPRLIHFDSFEPFEGAVSGSCGFYAFKESLSPETSSRRPCVCRPAVPCSSVHFWRTSCFPLL